MKLTEKCKEKFIFWMCKNHEYVRWHEYETMPECCINALIIDFFDSVGIRIGIDPYYDMQGTYRANIEHQGFQSMDRNVAIVMAITAANEIYNET